MRIAKALSCLDELRTAQAETKLSNSGESKKSMLSYRPIFLFLKSGEVHEEMWITRHHEYGNPSHG
jgi:hypothetical protein